MTAFGELGEHGLWLRLVVALRFLPLYFVALGPRYNKPITPPKSHERARLGPSERARASTAANGALKGTHDDRITVDSSEVPHDWPGLGSFGDVAKLWPNTTRVSQPYRLESGLVEVPDNGCLADYLTSDEMVENFEAVVQAGGGKPVVLALGFHQETAAKFLPRLCSALVEIEEKAEERCIPLHYQRTDDVALGFEADAIVEDKSSDEEGAVAIYKKELVFAS